MAVIYRRQMCKLLNVVASFVTVAAFCCLAQSESQHQAAHGENPEVLGHSKLAPMSLINYLVPNATYSSLLAQSQPDNIEMRLLSLLSHVGPDMKPADGFVDPQNVTLAVTRRAWQLMRQHAAGFANERVGLMWPVIRQALVEAQVSGKCLMAAERVADAARELKTWAIRCK
jgi:hypothetical protein